MIPWPSSLLDMSARALTRATGAMCQPDLEGLALPATVLRIGGQRSTTLGHLHILARKGGPSQQYDGQVESQGNAHTPALKDIIR